MEASSARLYEGKSEARKERRNPNIDDDPRYTKLTTEEIENISQKFATEWRDLGFYLKIPDVQLAEISLNNVNGPDGWAKSKKILEIFNEQTNFDRHVLDNCLEEIDRDLKVDLFLRKEVLFPPKQFFHEMEASSSTLYQGTSEAWSKRREPDIEGTKEASCKVEKLVTCAGGNLMMEDVMFEIGSGCLEDSTMIKLVKVNNPSFIKSLLDLELLQSSICHLQCLPNGVHFLKPAQLQININEKRGFSETALEKIVALYGSYSNDKQKMEWQQVEDIDLNESRILLNISKFSWYSFIEAFLSLIPRILCHLNHSIPSYAYVFHRRSSEMGTLDIKVVFVSSFVREKLGDSPMIKLAKDWEDFHANNNNEDVIDINTDRNHDIQLTFQGEELDSYTFKIDISKLDNDGFVVDHFSRIQVNFPAKGYLEVKESENKNSKWKLNVDEENSQGAVINKDRAMGASSARPYQGTSEASKERRKPNIDEVSSGDDANAKDVGNSPGVENTKQELVLQEWKYIDESTKHKELFLKLIEYGRNSSDEVKLVDNVRVIFSEEFCIGKGSDATRVYLGLGKDGYGKAVKRIHRDNYIQLALHEKKILNEFNARKSKYVVNYSFLEEETGKEYVYLILDLCEESLESFVESSTLHDLEKVLPEILRQILHGLADLHSGPNPILHRDLKPTNVLRDSQGKFLIADFGISRMLNKDCTTYESKPNMGTEYWIAPESYCEDKDTVDKGRYKKESDVMNAGMVAYYIATKGKHPFGTKRHRLDNMLNGNPVGLDEIKDETLKDLLSWMLNLKPEDRPSAREALKHPFLMSDDEKFDLLCKVGNLQTDLVTGKIFIYDSSWTECLRLIRNINQHWNDRPRPRPQPEPFYKIDDHKAYILKKFPNLPVRVHATVRSDEELKNNTDLKNFFNFSERKPHQE